MQKCDALHKFKLCRAFYIKQIKMKQYILLLFIALFATTTCTEKQISTTLPEISDSAVNFIISSDLGRNGYYEQKTIAKIMGSIAENIDIELIAVAGDIHHFMGVESVSDPLWMTNYELIYDHPELMIDWYAVCGNHEYRGNTQAMLDYTQISRRWNMPAKYYTKVIDSEDGGSCRLVFIDTAPLIDKYWNNTLDYPDANKQDAIAQLQWIDSILEHSTEKWKIVIGHHPVYAETDKSESERTDMQARLKPILDKNNVDVYFSGHIHNFQHILPTTSKVNYVVNSSGSLSRKVKAIEGTLFCSSDPGFTICSSDIQTLKFFFINHKGENIYNYSINK